MLALAGAVVAACARGGQAIEDEIFDRSLLTPAYGGANLLVGPERLRERLGDPALRLFDLSDLPGYRDGHLPGARHFWWQDLIELHNPIYGMLLGPDGRQELMRDTGIRPDSTVVSYDRAGGVYAARLIWVLRYMGFTDAHLLVGGPQGWQASGGELTNAEAPSPSPGGIGDVRDEAININAADLLNRLDEPGLAILDTRTRAELDETWHDQLRVGRPRRRLARDPDHASRRRRRRPQCHRRDHRLRPARDPRQPSVARPDCPRRPARPPLRRLLGRLGQPG